MTEQALAEEEPHFCTNCGSPINSTDKFCTNCGADLRTQEVASTELESLVGEQQDSAASTPDVASSVSGTVAPAIAEAKPHRHGLVIGLSVASAVVLAIAVVLSLIATNVIPNPLVRERAVTFAIKAPHYNEKTDSKIPLHITGKTSSGRVISQHVYVSPKAPVVHLAPGQYTVQVEASPLLSSGDVYRIPQPLKIDTTKDNRLVGESKPVKQDLKFEVKPASEVTASDLQAVAKFAKKTATPVKKLDFLTEKIRRQKVATAFNSVLDMLSTTDYEPYPEEDEDGEGEYPLAQYSLLDIDQDGTPEMLTWFGVNGDKKRASTGPVGCGDEHDDFSGNRIWKYDRINNRAECLAGEQIPTPQIPSMQWFSYGFSMKDKTIRIPLFQDETWISIEGNNIRSIYKSFEQLKEEGTLVTGQDEEDWSRKDVFSDITQRDVLTLYAMSVPSSLTEQGIADYDKYALTVSNGVMNGERFLVGTIKLMSPKQVQEFQHRYVVEHHLDQEQDPMSTSKYARGCPDWDGIKSCGNPAALYPADMLMPILLPEGYPSRPRHTWNTEESNLGYLFRVGEYQNKKPSLAYQTDNLWHEKKADNSFADLLTPYANKRVLINTDEIWHDQFGRALPRSAWNVSIAEVVATLPEATGQSQEKTAQ